ncbi:hypothetical protein LCGC14_2231590 [marine sediment metagenome]|uniref:Uncharacterized protein n=1 Tax=marine sediment metagenome TaxID=412755 RepID=A0A0F9DVT9_9ZZZZ
MNILESILAAVLVLFVVLLYGFTAVLGAMGKSPVRLKDEPPEEWVVVDGKRRKLHKTRAVANE